MLHIYNTLSGKKEVFTPLHPGKVGFYICGPTVYNYVHIGNCRTFVVFDVVRRYLIYLGYQVRFVRNITDVGHLENDADEGEDKIAKKARLEQLEPMEIVQNYTLYFHQMLEKLGNLPPSIEPTATAHLIEQIELIKQILEKGYAYEKNGSIYFDVKKYHQDYNYGLLSGRKIEELLDHSRVLKNSDEKNDPVDFALWKKAEARHIMRWNSPWGEGFPGWHIECSAMSTKYLGSHFDIHAGGLDLKFPHHECEIAQNTAAHGQAPARFWMHSNMLTVNGQKMSKSAGNFLTPDQLFTGHSFLNRAYSPMVVRLFMLQAHYRSILDFSQSSLDAMEVLYQKINKTYQEFSSFKPSNAVDKSTDWLIFFEDCRKAMDDDFNTVLVLTHLQHAIKWMKQAVEKKQIHPEDQQEILRQFNIFWQDILGLTFRTEENSSQQTGQDFSEILLTIRHQAKVEKNFKLADQIRDLLKEKGWQIKDTKEGSELEFLV